MLVCGWLPAGPNASGDMATFESVAQSDYAGNLLYFTVSSDKLSPTVGASDAGVAYEVSFG